MHNNSLKIGVFDSGSGGLPIAQKIHARLQNEKYHNVSVVYYGDTANFPYGTKTKKQLRGIVKNNIHHLLAQGCNMIVIACNTASIIFNSDPTLNHLPNVYPVINLSAKLATGSGSRIHVISSNFTSSQKQYTRLIKSTNPHAVVVETGEQRLINAIENQDRQVIDNQLVKIAQKISPDTQVLVLGCTHFSYVKQDLLHYLSQNNAGTLVVDPAEAMANYVVEQSRLMQQNQAHADTLSTHFSGPTPAFLFSN